MATDWSWRAAALVAAGGAIGCVLRYFVGVYLTTPDRPWGTLVVNVLGSFAITLVLFGAGAHAEWAVDVRPFLVTGVLGGFTTMSSFAYESFAFVDEAHWARAAAYVFITLAGCLLAAALGREFARLLPG